MAANCEAIIFENRDGNRLFGTLHMPDPLAKGRPMIVLLSPGVKMRVGPHGLYNRMTEFFLRQGFSVFKFDFFGLGDSEGELNRELLAEVYLDTQTGTFVDDAEDALSWLQESCGVNSFVLGGLCGGAITGLLLAKDDKRVNGLLSLGIPTTLELGAIGRPRIETQGELAELRKGYIRRLFEPKSWLRLLTFRSDFKSIFRSLAQLLKKGRKLADPGADRAENGELAPDANPDFAPAFFDVARTHRKHLLIFSERDRLYWEFEEKFAELHADQLEKVNDMYEIHVVKDANHIFSFREWENQMLEIAGHWLESNFSDHKSTYIGNSS